MIWILIVGYLHRSGRLYHLQEYLSSLAMAFNRIHYKITPLIALCMLALVTDARAIDLVSYHYEGDLPVPKNVQDLLFYLQRDPDRNTIVYKLNKNNGRLDNKNPVEAFWIRYEEGGKYQELSVLQRKLAYGVKSKPVADDKHELRFVSYPDLPLYLMRSETDKQYHIYTSILNRKAILQHVYIKVNSKKTWIPDVLYIELTGTDAITGKELVQQIFI